MIHLMSVYMMTKLLILKLSLGFNFV